jgi:acetyl esterase
MPIHHQTQTFLDSWEILNSLSGEFSVKNHRTLCQALNELSGSPLSIANIEEFIISGPYGDIPVKGFHPSHSQEKLPTIIHFPTGGFVGGDCVSNATMCQNLASRTGYRVFLVDFHKAPEYQYPAAVNDAVAATKYISQRVDVDSECIIVQGDSAGGNLALQTSLYARDSKEFKIKAQVLMMPWVDLSCSLESVKKNDGKGVSSEAYLKWCADLYLGDQYSGKEPEVSPVFREDLDSLPPSIIIVAEYDAQASESRLLAERLQVAGNEVTYLELAGMIHIFMSMEGILRESKATNIWLAEMLKAYN